MLPLFHKATGCPLQSHTPLHPAPCSVWRNHQEESETACSQWPVCLSHLVTSAKRTGCQILTAAERQNQRSTHQARVFPGPPSTNHHCPSLAGKRQPTELPDEQELRTPRAAEAQPKAFSGNTREPRKAFPSVFSLIC